MTLCLVVYNQATLFFRSGDTGPMTKTRIVVESTLELLDKHADTSKWIQYDKSLESAFLYNEAKGRFDPLTSRNEVIVGPKSKLSLVS